jgi:hypothetical protein
MWAVHRAHDGKVPRSLCCDVTRRTHGLSPLIGAFLLGCAGLPATAMIRESQVMGNLGIQHLTQYYNQLNGPVPTEFKTLDTCSWEQTESWVKVYVPLRGVHSDLLYPHFTSNSVEVRHFAGNVKLSIGLCLGVG